MSQDQFHMRLILLMAVGVVYVKAYMNMANRHSKETEPERHLILKCLGGFFAVMGVLMGCMGVYMITQIPLPQEAFLPNGEYVILQSKCISHICGSFVCFALSAYCFMFKSSHSKWYEKVGKVVFCILFFIFFASATDGPYIAPVLFVIMAFIALRSHLILGCLGSFFAIIAVFMAGVAVSVAITGGFVASSFMFGVVFVVVFVALSAYCFTFKSTHSKWYAKVGKVVFCIFVSMFFSKFFAAEMNFDFHNFGLYEWIVSVLFIIMAFFAFRNKQEKITEPIVEENKDESLDTTPIHIEENNGYLSKIEDESKYMPRIEIEQDELSNSDEDSREIENNQQSEAITAEEPSVNEVEQANSSIVNEGTIKNQSIENPANLEQINSEQVIKFCSHCGGKLNYQSGKYCKHCGKQLY